MDLRRILGKHYAELAADHGIAAEGRGDRSGPSRPFTPRPPPWLPGLAGGGSPCLEQNVGVVGGSGIAEFQRQRCVLEPRPTWETGAVRFGSPMAALAVYRCDRASARWA